jgi:hypothetical protein
MTRTSSISASVAFRWLPFEIEHLAIGNCFLRKEKQDPSLKQNYEVELD